MLNMHKIKTILIFLPLYYLSFYICRYSILPIGPLLIEKNNLGTVEYGLSLSALYFGYVLMLMPAGLIVRKIGAKKTIFLGVIGTIIANIMMLMSLSVLTLFLALFLNGLTQGLIWPSLMQIVALNIGKNRMDWIVGLMMTAAIIGPSLVFVLGGFLISLNLPWSIFIVGPIILLLLTFLFIKIDFKSKTYSVSRKINPGYIDKNIVLLAVIYFCFYSILRGIIGWLPSFLISELKLGESLASIGSSIFPLLETTGAFIGGYFSNRTKNVRIVFVTAFLLSFISLITYSVTNISIILVGIAFLSISMPEWLFFSRLPLMVKAEEVAFASGFIDTMGYIGSSISSYLIGYMVSITENYEYVILLLAFYSVIGLLFSFFIELNNKS